MEIQTNRTYTALTSGSSSPQQRQTYAAVATSLADKTTISQAARDRLADEPKGDSTYDFTNIAPNDMLNTINSLIKNGKMSLDESSSLLAFVPPTELNAAMGKSGITNQPINLFSSLEKMIAFNKSIHNDAGVTYAQKALSALERLQSTH
jgi:hypothetical protein